VSEFGEHGPADWDLALAGFGRMPFVAAARASLERRQIRRTVVADELREFLLFRRLDRLLFERASSLRNAIADAASFFARRC
jgi:hypothetical protein